MPAVRKGGQTSYVKSKKGCAVTSRNVSISGSVCATCWTHHSPHRHQIKPHRMTGYHHHRRVQMTHEKLCSLSHVLQKSTRHNSLCRRYINLPTTMNLVTEMFDFVSFPGLDESAAPSVYVPHSNEFCMRQPPEKQQKKNYRMLQIVPDHLPVPPIIYQQTERHGFIYSVAH